MRAAFVLLSTALVFAQSDALVRKSQEAKQLMAEGRFADAIPAYEELTRALPANTGLRLNLALAYHMSGRHRDAVPQFELVLKSDPSNVPALLSLGAAYLELKEPAKAVTPLEKVATVQPAYAPSRGMLANALLSLDRAAEAVPHFRKLTTLTPQDPKAWYGLGRTYEVLARQSFEKAAQGSAEWLALIGDTRMERRQYRSAFYFYKKALEQQPDFSAIHLSLAELYRRSDHSDWAGIEEKKATRPNCATNKQACNFAAARFTEAAAGPSIYWRTRAYNELALLAFKQLGVLPASVELHSIKAEIHSNHGQHLEAAQEWRAAQSLAPGDPRIANQLAIALYEGANYTEAVPLLQALLQRDPQSAEVNFFLGDSFLRMEQPDKALPMLEAAVKHDPKLLPARGSLGLAYIRLNRDADAITHLNVAREIDEDGSIHFQLAQAYRRAGNAEASKQMLAEYTRIQQRSKTEESKLEEEAAITAP